MKSRCFRCRGTWGEGNPEVDGYTDGLCPKCMKEGLARIYHPKQLAEGNFDCFGRSNGFCDQALCKYRKPCLEHEPVLEPEISATKQIDAASHLKGYTPRSIRTSSYEYMEASFAG